MFDEWEAMGAGDQDGKDVALIRQDLGFFLLLFVARGIWSGDNALGLDPSVFGSWIMDEVGCAGQEDA